MTRHPEQLERGSDGRPYDPDEPLVVRWADLVAARNAASALLVVLKDDQVDLEATVRSVGWQVHDWLTTAVDTGPQQALESREEAVRWLEDLVQRLWRCLP